MTIIQQLGGEWSASYKGAIGWGASIREAIEDCWGEYVRYYR